MTNRTLLLAVMSVLGACSPTPAPLDARDAQDETRDAGSDIATNDVQPIDDVPSTADVQDDTVSLDVNDDAQDSATTDVIALTDAGNDDADAIANDAQPGPWLPFPGSTCNARQREYPLLYSPHYEADAGGVFVYNSNPPSSGPHCPLWARWGVWDAIPRCNWIHNLEHSGVVMLYQCPSSSCTATRDALASVVSALPDDPLCTPSDAAPARVRVVVTRDDQIESPIAAAAWGWIYTADCIEPATLRQFYLEHYGRTVENFCAEGFIP